MPPAKNQNIKQKQNYNQFNKDFKKLVHIQKKKKNLLKKKEINIDRENNLMETKGEGRGDKLRVWD